MSFFGLGRDNKTLRPKKSVPVGSKGLTLKRHIDATLGQGNIREAVKLPPGEDMREWLAVNTVDFYNAVSILHSTLEEYCTPSSCPSMTAGPRYEYLWADQVKVKTPIKLTAPDYINALFDWIEVQVEIRFKPDFELDSSHYLLCESLDQGWSTEQFLERLIDDRRIFPQSLGEPFPPDFINTVRTIFKRLFRVYAHIYHSHFKHICALQEQAHLNTCFRHFVYFIQTFDLVDEREMNPMRELIGQICR